MRAWRLIAAARWPGFRSSIPACVSHFGSGCAGLFARKVRFCASLVPGEPRRNSNPRRCAAGRRVGHRQEKCKRVLRHEPRRNAHGGGHRHRHPDRLLDQAAAFRATAIGRDSSTGSARSVPRECCGVAMTVRMRPTSFDINAKYGDVVAGRGAVIPRTALCRRRLIRGTKPDGHCACAKSCPASFAPAGNARLRCCHRFIIAPLDHGAIARRWRH